LVAFRKKAPEDLKKGGTTGGTGKSTSRTRLSNTSAGRAKPIMTRKKESQRRENVNCRTNIEKREIPRKCSHDVAGTDEGGEICLRWNEHLMGVEHEPSEIEVRPSDVP